MFRVKLLLFTLSISFVACTSNEPEGNEISPEILQGHWDLVSAKRNGQATETLNTTFFEFHSEGKMISNLAGSREEIQYELSGNILKQLDGRMPADYEILEINDSLLHVTMVLREIPFDLHFRKVSSENLN
ncbi:MAG: hypothetical protein KDC34_06010 [Saprospiraceae bacterium]|nr:hypothetical protein [Saprospiraceae bacterium]